MTGSIADERKGLFRFGPRPSRLAVSEELDVYDIWVATDRTILNVFLLRSAGCIQGYYDLFAA